MHTYSNEVLTEMHNEKAQNKQILPKLLIVFITIAVSFFEDSLGAYLPYLVVGAMFLGFFVDRILPICIYVPTTMFNIEFGILEYVTLAILIVSCFVAYIETEKSQRRENWTGFFFVCLFVFASTYFGYESNPVTAVVTIMTMFYFYCYCSIFRGEKARLVEFALFVSGVVMMAFVLRQIASGSAIYLWGTRLTFEESVRDLANAVAFSIYYAFCRLAITKSEKDTFKSKIFHFVIFAAGSYVLFMTYSRGVLLSVGVACIIAILFTLKKISVKHIIGIVAVIIFAIWGISSMQLDTTLLSNDVAGGSGLLEFWAYFIRDMFSDGIVRILFGYGPGEFARVSYNSPFRGFYAHSLFMDAWFSFGILGIIYLMKITLNTVKLALHTKSAYIIGLTVLTVLMYAAHGNSSNYQFYLMLGLSYAIAVSLVKPSEEAETGESSNE